ncbi:MAG: hypothetical protein HND58_01480 [Planctomycetota bacterium]|nr:MAG: hypothetical protein HND58_01480 [Planctomycetota bacterium]
MIERTTRLKGDAVATRDEAIANELLAYEYMLDALANELDMYIALKQDAPGRAWTHLVNAQMAASHAVKAHEVAARLELLYIPRLHALERLCFPKQVFASVSFIVEESECSICHAAYGECDHIKGRPYMGELCARIVTKCDVQEVSLVEEPASKHCRLTAVSDEDGVMRDPLSLEQLREE